MAFQERIKLNHQLIAKASTIYDSDLAEDIDVNERIDGELTEKDGDEYDIYRFATGGGKVTGV